MLALYIITGILLLFLLTGMISVSLNVKISDEPVVSLGIGFVRIRLAPKKKRALSLKDFEIERFRKKRIKEEKKYRRSLQKKAKKAKDKPKTEEKTEKQKPKRTPAETFEYAKDILMYVVKDAVARFGRCLRVKIRRLCVAVATEDAAKTAVTYGTVCQLISYFSGLVGSAGHVNICGPVGAYCDFSSQKTAFDVNFTMSIRVWQIISVGITALRGYTKIKKAS